MFSPKKILVPVDFSEVSRAAINAALQLAAHNDGAIYLLHIDTAVHGQLDRPDHEASTAEATIASDEEALMQAIAVEKDRFVAAGLPRPEVAVHTRIADGDWSDVAVQMVDDEQIDLVVTGTHGRQGLLGRLFGTESEQVVARAPCSVMVVKAPGFPYLRD